MSDVYPVPADWAKKAFVTATGYEDAYAQSIRDPDTFWREEAKRLDWMTPFTKALYQSEKYEFSRSRFRHQMV
ncbi:MAG: acetate--CoA ligase [Pseudomonadota bacterium]